MLRTNEELKPIGQDESETTDTDSSPKYYGNLVKVCPGPDGEPKWTLGPHCSPASSQILSS
jgi:hypothetical protein